MSSSRCCHTPATTTGHWRSAWRWLRACCPHRQQPVTRHWSLAGLVAHRRWWRPRGGLELRCQAGEVRRIRRVGLGPAQLRLGEMVRLLRVDHRDPVARLVRRDGEGDPIIAGRLQDGERRSRWHARGLGVPLERRKSPSGSTVARERHRGHAARWQPCHSKGVGGDIDTDVQVMRHAWVDHPPSFIVPRIVPRRRVPWNGSGLRSGCVVAATRYGPDSCCPAVAGTISLTRPVPQQSPRPHHHPGTTATIRAPTVIIFPV